MKRIYISGPISGLDRAVYLANFAERERKLRAQGFDVLNPTRLPPSRWLWIYKVLGYRLTLLYDLWHLLRCDGIAYQPNWSASPGANVEHRYAMSVGIPEIPEQLKVWSAVEGDIQDRAIKARNNEKMKNEK